MGDAEVRIVKLIDAVTIVGPQGPIGLTGPTGPIGPPISFIGTYDPGHAYGIGNAVAYGGSSYISLSAGNTGNQPDLYPANWAILAQRSDTTTMEAVALSIAMGNF